VPLTTRPAVPALSCVLSTIIAVPPGDKVVPSTIIALLLLIGTIVVILLSPNVKIVYKASVGVGTDSSAMIRVPSIIMPDSLALSSVP
jgi:hypothetical protein